VEPGPPPHRPYGPAAAAGRSGAGRRARGRPGRPDVRARARETCELAGFADRAEICEDLREWDYGDCEGRTTVEIREQNPDWVLWRDGCPGGESPDHVAARADRALERLRASDGDAIAFAHGHILRVLTARYLQLPLAAGARFVLGAGAFSTLGYEHENEALLRWNDTGE